MKKIVIILLLLAAIIAAAYVYYALGKPAPRAADLLPDSTLVFLDVPNFSQSRADFAKTEMYALWHEPEVQAFLAKPLAALHDALINRGAPKEENALGERLLDLMQGEVFLAVTRVTIFPAFNPGLVLGVDVRRKRIEAAAALYTLENNLKQSHPKGRFQEKKYLGVTYSIWETFPGMPICHASLNSLFVFTLGEDTMRDVIACHVGQVPRDFKRLATSPKYRNVIQHTGKNNEFLAYCNVEEILTLVGPLLMLTPQTSGLHDTLSRIQTSAASVTFVDGGIEDVGFVAYSRATEKPTPATARETLALTTPDTLLYWASSAELAALYDQAMQSLSQSGNANLMAAAGQFQQTLRSRGVRINEDVLPKLGPEYAVIANWRVGARAPDCALVSAITDAARLRPALDGVMSALKETVVGDDDRFPWDETEYAGQTLRTVHIGPGILAPTYTTTDQFFILAGTPDYARELLAQVKDAKPTLAQNALYTQSMKRLPANGSSYLYADLRSLFGPLYALGTSSLSLIGTNDFVDTATLPPSATIAKHLFPFVSTTVSEPRQETSMSFSPFGKGIALAAGIGGAIWVSDMFGPTLEQTLTPALPKKSSNRPAPSAPHENQTEESQTPTPQ